MESRAGAGRHPAARAALDRLGVDVVDDSTPESLRDFVPGQIAKWTQGFESAGIEVK